MGCLPMTALEKELLVIYALACRQSRLKNIECPAKPRAQPRVSFVTAFIVEAQKILRPLREAGWAKLHDELRGKLLALGLKHMLSPGERDELRKAL